MNTIFNNVSNLKNCYGCGICTTICKNKIIDLHLNANGFYEPIITKKNLCIGCKLCLKVCAYFNKDISTNTKNIKGYAAWSNNKEIRYNCSSGGISFELGSYLLTKGYNGCAVEYNTKKNIAEHYICNNEQSYRKSIGSKYIQSYTLTAFNNLKKEEKYFIIGTPCQIDSIRRYINQLKINDNFILIDFFCHGVPSMNMWKKYIKFIQKKVDNIEHLTWRNKINGWQNSWAISASNNNFKSYISSKEKNDMFYYMFLGHYCLGRQCFNSCKYKKYNSAADVRIGDLWGNKYKANEQGISGILIFSEIGRDLIFALRNENRITLKEESLSIVTEGQLINNVKKPFTYPLIEYLLKTKLSLRAIVLINNLLIMPLKIISKLLKLLK